MISVFLAEGQAGEDIYGFGDGWDVGVGASFDLNDPLHDDAFELGADGMKRGEIVEGRGVEWRVASSDLKETF